MDTTTQELLAGQMHAQASVFNDLAGSERFDEELYDLALDVQARREVSALLCTGGPHIEAVAVLDGENIVEARLEGRWGSTRDSWPITEGSGLWCALEAYAAAMG